MRKAVKMSRQRSQAEKATPSIPPRLSQAWYQQSVAQYRQHRSQLQLDLSTEDIVDFGANEERANASYASNLTKS